MPTDTTNIAIILDFVIFACTLGILTIQNREKWESRL